ncbi:MAG: type II secretion system F family protein [Chloroflexi bacterium]|nr:type II secretion system F family protein [Chloroflexota bacterium]
MEAEILIIIWQWLASPAVCAGLVALAVLCLWLSFGSGRGAPSMQERLDGYIASPDALEQEEMSQPFVTRVLKPLVHQMLRRLGKAAPGQAMEATEQLLIRAGQPGHLTALDFYGLRLLFAVGFGCGGFWLASLRYSLAYAALIGLMMAGGGFALPALWLKQRAAQREAEITRALPNALDMLTIGVEAGLAFESAMLRVAEQWDNALTQEFRQAVLEMRVGASRNEALKRVAERTGVPDLHTFVAVLVQSSQLGVSIAQVLHNQAAVIRQKRRQRAEEQARQASVKMAFPLVFLIFPAMLVVILGPALPGIIKMINGTL